MKTTSPLALLLVLFLTSPVVWGDETSDVALQENCKIHFASLEEGREHLGRRDRYIAALSPFDRQSRMGSAEEVPEADFLKFVAEQAVAWEEKQIAWLTERWIEVSKRLVNLKLPLPPQLLLIQTTGKEEGNAAYCRYPAIILPAHVLRRSADDLERLLTHELFHILSVHAPWTRTALYRVIGFRTMPEIPLPPPLQVRKITNPDAPLLDSWVTVDVNGQPTVVAPILYASVDRFVAEPGATFFRYMQFRLLALEQVGDRWQPIMNGDQPVLFEAKKIPSYFDQIGKNTEYIIHPDEILADNFVHLVFATKSLPTPHLIDELQRVLAR